MRCMTWVGSTEGICDLDPLPRVRGRARVGEAAAMNDPLQCTFEDARRQHLRDGIAMSTAAKVAWFEEMVSLAVHFGAVDRLRDRPMERNDDTAG